MNGKGCPPLTFTKEYGCGPVPSITASIIGTCFARQVIWFKPAECVKVYQASFSDSVELGGTISFSGRRALIVYSEDDFESSQPLAQEGFLYTAPPTGQQITLTGVEGRIVEWTDADNSIVRIAALIQECLTPDWGIL